MLGEFNQYNLKKICNNKFYIYLRITLLEDRA